MSELFIIRWLWTDPAVQQNEIVLLRRIARGPGCRCAVHRRAG